MKVKKVGIMYYACNGSTIGVGLSEQEAIEDSKRNEKIIGNGIGNYFRNFVKQFMGV